jgi:hypothetical protein
VWHLIFDVLYWWLVFCVALIGALEWTSYWLHRDLNHRPDEEERWRR